MGIVALSGQKYFNFNLDNQTSLSPMQVQFQTYIFGLITSTSNLQFQCFNKISTLTNGNTLSTLNWLCHVDESGE